MEAVAKLQNSQYSPRKMRLLADMVRGIPVHKALFLLKEHPKSLYATQMEKVLRSAIANWQQKNEDGNIDEAQLVVKKIFVDGARVLKRIQPAPQGRVHRLRKRFNHLTIVVDEQNSDNTEK